MNRLECVRKEVYHIFDGIDDEAWRCRALTHSHAVALTASLLARRRGANPELAAVAGLLHDLYAYEHRDYTDHASLGAARAKVFLAGIGLFSENEIGMIADAVFHHDDLDVVSGLMDEILKDADLCDNALSDPNRPVRDTERDRVARLLRELGCPGA